MKKPSDSLRVGSLLTFIGGFLEIYSFLLKGNVFATAITGNIVLMFYYVSKSEIYHALRYIFPISGFCFGIILSYKLKEKINKEHLHFREVIMLIEIFLIILIYLLKDHKYIVVGICLISTLSGLQFQTFKSIRGNNYVSTMFSGNTRRLIEFILDKNYEKAKIYLFILIFFGLGVIIGGISISIFKESAILILLIPMSFIYHLIRKHEGKL